MPPQASGKTNKVNKTSKTAPTQDRAHDVLRSEPHPLDAIFRPTVLQDARPTVREAWASGVMEPG
jgi:hypothetical protein